MSEFVSVYLQTNIYLQHVSSYMFVLYCGSFWPRSRHRRDSDKRPEHLRDKMDTTEDGRDQVRHKSEHWRKRDALDVRCCYLCGSSAHIKKDCQLYRSPAGSHSFLILFFSMALLSPSKRHVFELATLFVQEIVMH